MSVLPAVEVGVSPFLVGVSILSSWLPRWASYGCMSKGINQSGSSSQSTSWCCSSAGPVRLNTRTHSTAVERSNNSWSGTPRCL